MTRRTDPVMCLSDRMLWMLSEGGGGAVEREHLEGCGLCRERARDLEDDLGAIGQVLRGPLPPAVIASPAPARVGTWAPVAAVLLLALVALWAARRVPPVATSEDGVAALGDLSATVFADDDEAMLPTDLDVVATAFEE